MPNRSPNTHDTQLAIRKFSDRQALAAIPMRLQISAILVLLHCASCAPTPEDSPAIDGPQRLVASTELTTVELDQMHLGIEDSHSILESQMPASQYQAIEGRHVKIGSRVIKTERDAIELAKPIFLEKFGNDHGLGGRHHTGHLIHGFWVVKGLLPRGFSGGTQVAVLDSESGDLYCTLIWK